MWCGWVTEDGSQVEASSRVGGGGDGRRVCGGQGGYLMLVLLSKQTAWSCARGLTRNVLASTAPARLVSARVIGDGDVVYGDENKPQARSNNGSAFPIGPPATCDQLCAARRDSQLQAEACRINAIVLLARKGRLHTIREMSHGNYPSI